MRIGSGLYRRQSGLFHSLLRMQWTSKHSFAFRLAWIPFRLLDFLYRLFGMELLDHPIALRIADTMPSIQ